VGILNKMKYFFGYQFYVSEVDYLSGGTPVIWRYYDNMKLSHYLRWRWFFMYRFALEVVKHPLMYYRIIEGEDLLIESKMNT